MNPSVLILTGDPVRDLDTTLRLARRLATDAREDAGDTSVRAFVRCLGDELTDCITGLQDARCEDAEDERRWLRVAGVYPVRGAGVGI